MFFQPSNKVGFTPDFFELSYETRYIDTPDGERLFAWLMNAKTPKAVVVFLHGNAGNVSEHLPSVFWLPFYGYTVLAADYRGYGASSGKPSVMGAIVDVQTAIGYALADPALSKLPIVVYAQSLGGSLSVTAIDTGGLGDSIALLITEGAFASYGEIAQDVAGRSWLTWIAKPFVSSIVERQFDPAVHIGNLAPLPILIIHGDHDPIVGYNHAHRLFDAAREPKELWILFGGGHIGNFNNAASRKRFVETIERLMR
ncbi:phospholipase [Campylobacterota bacterium]|nr:phospholipase [Campylobacterota bacterium]